MSKFLPVRTSPNAAIGICQRCQKKMYRSQLRLDSNKTGLLVCSECSDQLDPYKLPPRQPESIVIDRPLPDEKLDA